MEVNGLFYERAVGGGCSKSGIIYFFGIYFTRRYTVYDEEAQVLNPSVYTVTLTPPWGVKYCSVKVQSLQLLFQGLRRKGTSVGDMSEDTPERSQTHSRRENQPTSNSKAHLRFCCISSPNSSLTLNPAPFFYPVLCLLHVSSLGRSKT